MGGRRRSGGWAGARAIWGGYQRWLAKGTRVGRAEAIYGTLREVETCIGRGALREGAKRRGYVGGYVELRGWDGWDG